ncbi:hypothetical protein [Streptomyces fungicidicus]
MTVTVQDTGEGKAGRAAPDYSDTVPHGDTPYFLDALHRKSRMRP